MFTRWFLGAVSGVAIMGAAAQPYRPVVVLGRSMAPTYRSGEILWTAPVDRPLRRGDVIIADGPDGPVIKRVALLPGDRREQWRTAEGWVDLDFARPSKSCKAKERLRTWTVPAGKVFLMGDNLNVSIDSRRFGPISIDQIRRIVVDDREPSPDSILAGETAQSWLADAIRNGARRMVARR